MPQQQELWWVCLIAFVAVLTLLSLLGLAMRLLTTLFPPPTSRTDAAVVGALHTAVGAMMPGARISRIEETTKERTK